MKHYAPFRRENRRRMAFVVHHYPFARDAYAMGRRESLRYETQGEEEADRNVAERRTLTQITGEPRGSPPRPDLKKYSIRYTVRLFSCPRNP